MAETGRGGITIQRTPVIVAVNACMFIFGLILLLMGSLLPSLQVSNARAGSLGSFPLIGILISTIFIGPILDKVGAKPALSVGLALIAAAMAALPSLASYPAMAAAALVYGLGGGILNTATNAAISDLSASGRGVALNVLGFSFSLGAVTAPLLISLSARTVSVPTVLRIMAMAPSAVLVLILALRFPAPAHSGTSLGSLLKVLNHPMVWMFGFVLFFASGNENCMFVWAGRMVRDTLQVSAERADLALVALSVTMGAGRLWAALGLKMLGSRKILLLAAAIIIAGVAIVLTWESFGGMVTGFAVMGLGMSAIFPTTLGLAGDRFPNQTGTVFGAAMTVALVGGVAGPLVGGWAATSSPQRVLAVPLIAGTAIAALTLIFIGRGIGISGGESRS
jgi:FHS family glucose/mannose:H+ symporter-like MFS transporter